MKNFVTEHFWCVKQIHVFRDLSEVDARALAQITTFKNLKHEERIREEGVYLLKEGRVKISENLSDADSEKLKSVLRIQTPMKSKTQKRKRCWNRVKYLE